MEDNEVLENVNEQTDGSPDSYNEFGVSDESNNVTDEQIIDAIRSLIDENNIEGDSLSGDEVGQESSSEASEVVEYIDYTDLLTEIKYELTEINSHLVSIEEYQQSTLFDKQLVEYNISDSLLVLVVVFFLVKGLVELIKHFSPKIWK